MLLSAAKPHFCGLAYIHTRSERPKASWQQFEEPILSRIDNTQKVLLYKNDMLTVQIINFG